MSVSVWIDVEHRREERLWDYTASVARDGKDITIEFRGTGRSGSATGFDPNHRLEVGLRLPASDAVHLAQALLMAAYKENSSGSLMLAADPDSAQQIHGLVTQRLVGVVVPLNKVSEIKFAGIDEAQSVAAE